MSGLVRRAIKLVRSLPVEPTAQNHQPMDREEKGFPPVNEGAASRSAPERASTLMSERVPMDDPLLIFRTLTGIDTHPAISHAGHTARTAANIGIYTRVVREERQAKKSYRAISLGIHLCLALQIVIGAAITAVAASSGSHRAITGLGAMNTIFAGALAYVKGSGYPDSLQHHELEWKKIREYVEQRERELCLAGAHIDVYHEVRVIEDMYQRTKRELKISRAGRDSKAVEHKDIGKEEVMVPRRSGDLRPDSTLAPTTATATTAVGSTQNNLKKPELEPSAVTSVPEKPREN